MANLNLLKHNPQIQNNSFIISRIYLQIKRSKMHIIEENLKEKCY